MCIALHSILSIATHNWHSTCSSKWVAFFNWFRRWVPSQMMTNSRAFDEIDSNVVVAAALVCLKWIQYAWKKLHFFQKLKYNVLLLLGIKFQNVFNFGEKPTSKNFFVRIGKQTDWFFCISIQEPHMWHNCMFDKRHSSKYAKKFIRRIHRNGKLFYEPLPFDVSAIGTHNIDE